MSQFSRFEQMSDVEIGFGPMSLNSITAIVQYANAFDRPLMIIASRNQVDRHGGYVGPNTTQLVDYVRSIDTDRKIWICRDHTGPFMQDSERNYSFADTMSSTMKSISSDIEAGFDLIHIDTCRAEDPYSAARILFKYALDVAKSNSRDVMFEFGSEENVGVAASVEKFEKDVQFVTKFVQPMFVVGQTGSLVKSCRQAGQFNSDAAKRMSEIAFNYGTYFKEHNCDYQTSDQIFERFKCGVGGINIAPELGCIETATVVGMADKYSIDLDPFINVVVEGNKWKKWVDDDSFDPRVEGLMCAGHYHYNTPEWLELEERLSDYGVAEEIFLNLYKAFDRYTMRNK